MKKILLKTLTIVLKTILISAVMYIGIAAFLIITGKFDKPVSTQKGPSFDALFFNYSKLPEIKKYTARDGTKLAYRLYPGRSKKILVLLHGAAWHSRYFLPLAEYLSSQNIAQVYTPDLRGHGLTPKRRGDVNYIGQFEDDLADFIDRIEKDNPNAMIILGGHSSGGGLAVRFAGSRYGKKADAYLLMAPFLKYDAPTTRPNSGGFAQPYTRRIIGLVMLNTIGIRWFNFLKVIDFNIPQNARDGSETLSYSYRLMTAYAPKDYKKDLGAIKQPLLVVAGTRDESMMHCQYQPTISKYTKAQIKLLHGVSHMGIVVGFDVRPVIKKWIKER